MSNSYKMIRISTKTYNDLGKLGKFQDTFDSVVSRLITQSRVAAASRGITEE
ncbi:MAG TPA: hypothetical protein VH415_13715 [Nitrososphaeraceae archaeon]